MTALYSRHNPVQVIVLLAFCCCFVLRGGERRRRIIIKALFVNCVFILLYFCLTTEFNNS